MVELTLILSIGLLAATAAVLLARWSLAQAPGTLEAARVLGAVRRAGDDFAWRQNKRALGAGLALAVSLLVTTSVAGRARDTAGDLPWSLPAGVLLGALLGIAAGQLAVHLSPPASDRVATAMRRATHTHAIAIALRAGAAIGMGTEVLSLLAACGVLLIHPLGSAAAFDAHAGPLLAGIALGASATALLAQCSGAALLSSGQHGRRQQHFDHGKERFDLNPQNPSLVLDLVSNHVGITAPRAQDAFAASMLAHCACLAIGTAVTHGTHGPLPPTLALLALPVLARAFGVLASCVSLISTRADESDDAADILWRGHLAMASVALASLAGLSVWVWGEAWLPWFACSSLGVVASLVVAFSRHRLSDRRTPAAKDLRETAQLSSRLALSEAMAIALRTSLPPLLAVGLCAALAAELGARALEPTGALLALSFLLCGFCMALPYLQALTLVDPIIDGGCALASLDDGKRPELHHRATRLNQTALSSGSTGQGYFATVSALLGVPIAAAIAALSSSAPLSPTSPWQATFHLSGAVLGLGLVLGAAGFGVLHAARAARKLCADMQGLVRGDGSKPERDFKPRYAEALSASGERALAWGAMGPLALTCTPILLTALLLVSGAAAHTTDLLSSLVGFTSAAGVGLALTAAGLWSLLSAARRQSRPSSERHHSNLGLIDADAEFFGNALCPAIVVVTRGVMATGLALALTIS